MDKYVISDQLTSLIDGQKVVAGVFTTYNFEPDFFELDVIPLLLKQGLPFSSDDRVKSFQVREALRESSMQLEVFYDLPVFRQSAERSPEMEYLCHGVNEGNNAFHAKSIYLLVKDSDTDLHRLLVAAGSNNLTRAGWWENIEVQHWEEVVSGQAQRAFINRLKEDVDWLIEKRSLRANTALEKISVFLRNCRGQNDADAVHYYGPSNERDVISFLHSVRTGTLDNYQNWSLEIISPFFADNTKNELHKKFIETFGLNNILMLLPQDQEGTALCERDYYLHISDADDVEWARWNPKISKLLGASEGLFRRVHAKIYHFYNKKQAWAFIGSVNFSHKAINDNVESGFLVKMDNIEPLLEAIPEDEIFEHFDPPSDSEAGGEGDGTQSVLPELHLSYDWINKILKGRTSKRKQYEIEIKNSEGSVVISSWLLKYQECSCDQPLLSLEELLGQGSLVTVNGKNKRTNEVFKEHRVLLQQTGWTHKPIDFPSLSPEQILEIYAGMSDERRQLMMMNAKNKHLVLKNMGGEITVDSNDTVDIQFFCEYAEVFHAFRMFKKRLFSLLGEKNVAQVDYYLTGKGMDSLPSLLERVCDKETEYFSGATAYLLMLGARDIYRDNSFFDRPNVEDCLQSLESNLESLKLGDTMKLEDNSIAKRTRFFTWFEYQFSKEYLKEQEVEEVIDEAS